MTHYILASHKHLAEGLYSAVETIIGPQEHVQILSAYVTPDEEVAKQIEALVGTIPPEDDLIVFTDIYGGSVNAEFMKYLSKRQFHLIAGMNLALVIAVILETKEDAKKEDILRILEECKASMQYLSHDVEVDTEEEF